ncbi:MAG: hypothetical protein HXY40_11230 [Chloroflexi bacterium]|nr:hypothetical protein [Chloroflexota bacterium]
MAYLNAQERDALHQELRTMKFGKAKWKLLHMDPKGRLAYYRNNQATGKWMTRFELVGLGTRVTLVETLNTRDKNGKHMAEYELIDVVVEPTPENRT